MSKRRRDEKIVIPDGGVRIRQKILAADLVLQVGGFFEPYKTDKRLVFVGTDTLGALIDSRLEGGTGSRDIEFKDIVKCHEAAVDALTEAAWCRDARVGGESYEKIALYFYRITGYS